MILPKAWLADTENSATIVTPMTILDATDAYMKPEIAQVSM